MAEPREDAASARARPSDRPSRPVVLAHQRRERRAADRADVELDGVVARRSRGRATWAPSRPGAPPCAASGSTGRDGRPAAADGLGGRLGGGSRSARVASDAKHWPHHSASAVARAPQLRHRRAGAGRGLTVHRASGTSGLRRRGGTTVRRPRRGASAASRSAIRGHVWARSTRARPAAPIRRASSGSSSRVATASATSPTVVPVHEDAGLAVHQRLAGAARVAHDHRPRAGGGLDEHVAPALHLEAAEPGAARHREHVAHRVVAREVLLGHLPGEDDRTGRRGVRRAVRSASS